MHGGGNWTEVDLARRAQGQPTATLPGYSSACKNLRGAVEHAHDHPEQLVLLKNLVRG